MVSQKESFVIFGKNTPYRIALKDISKYYKKKGIKYANVFTKESSTKLYELKDECL
jgi:hypothetical protein